MRQRILVPGAGVPSKEISIGLPSAPAAARIMPFNWNPHQLGGLQVGNDADRSANEHIRLVGLGDASDDGALLGADIDAELHQLFRIWHALGREDFRHAQVDLHEVVNRDAVVGRGLGGRSRRWRCRWRSGGVFRGFGHTLLLCILR